MRRRSLMAAAVASAATLALEACGTTEAATSGSASSGSGSLVLTDATGKTVRLDGPATRVVATEWDLVGDLVSLGVSPVGVADVKGYAAYSASVPLTGTPKDIGTRGEPSLDTIASLAPDLVVANTDLKAATITQLRRLAPVLVIRSARSGHQIARMEANLRLIATATGRTTRAEAVVAAYEQKVSAGRAALSAAGLAGAQVAFADGYVDANQVAVRPYTSGSLVGEVIAALGLTDAWTVTGDAAYGLATTDVEGLTKLPEGVRFVYTANTADGADPFAEVLATNAVWASLPFVTAGHVHRLTDGVWMFGGPASMSAFVDALVAALTA